VHDSVTIAHVRDSCVENMIKHSFMFVSVCVCVPVILLLHVREEEAVQHQFLPLRVVYGKDAATTDVTRPKTIDTASVVTEPEDDVVRALDPTATTSSSSMLLPPQQIPVIDPASNAGQLFPECLSSNWTKEVDLPHWADLDFTKYSICGKQKCFFQSRSDPDIGYLVSDEDKWSNMVRAAALEDQMSQKYGVWVAKLPHHEPQRYTVSQDMWCLLLFLVRPDDLRPDNPAKSKFRYRDSVVKPVIVQRVRKAPEPYVVLGSWSRRYEFTDFLHTVVPPANLEEFIVNMEADVNVMRKMLEEYPELYQDVQVMVDTRGRFFHFDTDRAFQEGHRISRGEEKFAYCMEGGLEEARAYLASLQNGTTTTAVAEELVTNE
jgi:hypothetical protein